MNNNKKKAVISIVTFLIAIVILALLSSPVMKIYDNNYSAMDLIKGVSFSLGSRYSTRQLTGFSFWNLLPYLLLVVALIMDYVKYAVTKLNNKWTRFVISAIYIIVGFLIIFGRFMLNVTDDAAVLEKKVIAWGAIVQAIIAWICAGLSIYDAILPFDEIEDEDTEESEGESVDDLKQALLKEMALNQENESVDVNQVETKDENEVIE